MQDRELSNAERGFSPQLKILIAVMSGSLLLVLLRVLGLI